MCILEPYRWALPISADGMLPESGMKIRKFYLSAAFNFFKCSAASQFSGLSSGELWKLLMAFSRFPSPEWGDYLWVPDVLSVWSGGFFIDWFIIYKNNLS
jgi:hypothetical protein